MRCNNFTLIEMIAVIAITSFLVMITIKIFKTDPRQAAVAQVGGACTFANAASIKHNRPVLIELRNNKFEASYTDDNGQKIIIKSFSVVSGTESKMLRGTSEIESYTIHAGQISGGNAVVYKIRKTGKGKAGIVWVNAFTGHVAYYDSNGNKEVAW